MTVFRINIVSMSSWWAFGFIFLISIVVISDCYNPDVNRDLSTNTKQRSIGWVNPDEMDNTELENMDNPFDMLGGKKFKSQNANKYEDLRRKLFQEEIFTRRFINLFLRCSGLHGYQLRPGSRKQVRFDFIIDHRQLGILQDFGISGKTSLADVDEVLTKLFIPNEGTLFEHLSSSFELFQFNWLSTIFNKIGNFFYSYEVLIVFVIGVILVTTVWATYRSKSYLIPIINVLILIFISGFAVTWMRLYQEADAAKFQAEMMDANTPPFCRGQPLGWLSTVYYYFHPPDCTAYYKHKLVHPFVKISPTVALSETVSQMIFHPVAHIGKAYGDLIMAVAGSLPWYLNAIVVPLVIVLPVLLILGIIICMGPKNISLTPLGLFITPSWIRPKATHSEQSKYIEEVADDKNSKKKKKGIQSIFSEIESPLFLMNWTAFRKIKATKSNKILMNNSDVKSISNENSSEATGSITEKTTLETDSEDESISSNDSSSNYMRDTESPKERQKSKRKKDNEQNTPLESPLDGSGDCLKKTKSAKKKKKMKSLKDKKVYSNTKEQISSSPKKENEFTNTTTKNFEVQKWLDDNYIH